MSSKSGTVTPYLTRTFAPGSKAGILWGLSGAVMILPATGATSFTPNRCGDHRKKPVDLGRSDRGFRYRLHVSSPRPRTKSASIPSHSGGSTGPSEETASMRLVKAGGRDD